MKCVMQKKRAAGWISWPTQKVAKKLPPFYYCTVTLPKTSNAGEKTFELWLVNGESYETTANHKNAKRLGF